MKVQEILKPKLSLLIALIFITIIISCDDDGNGTASPEENTDYFAVANRGSNTITFHSEEDLSLLGTTNLEDGAQPTYVVYSPERDRIYTGGLGSGMLYQINPETYQVENMLNVGAGAFHMWFNDTTDQLWVTNIGATKTTTVVDLNDFTVEQTLPLPTLTGVTFSASAVQHDVIISPNGSYAYVTILDGADISYLVQYNTSTFAVENFATFGGDGHLSFLNNRLFALAQNGNEIKEYNPETLEEIRTVAFDGAHGVTSNGSHLFIADLPGDRLARYNGTTNMIDGTVNTEFSATHNLAINDESSKILTTYSGGTSTKVQLFSVNGSSMSVLATGDPGTNPFGVWYVNR